MARKPTVVKRPYLRVVGDTLYNLITGMGTSRDKSYHTNYMLNFLDRGTLDVAYRGDWVARKIVDAPAEDSTRAWRAWQAEGDQIEALEKLERALCVRQRTLRALKLSRLYGGAALILGVDGQGDASEELNVEKVRKDDLKFVHAVHRHEVSSQQTRWNLEDPYFGEPEFYERSLQNGAPLHIHPSRVIRFIGREVPDITLDPTGWGDSVLQAVDDAVRAAGVVSGGIASLVQEAKIDVIRIPELTHWLATENDTSKLTARFAYANLMKSQHNMLLMDKEEEWERVTVSFAAMPDILKMYLLIASGAADIPATRMLGQSPAGLSSTGESDLRNYYDRISSDQNTALSPALERLDEVLIRSATGTRDPSVFYNWNPLWQMDESQKAELAAKKASIMSADVSAGLIPIEVLRLARQNQLIEDGTYPGLELAIEENADLEPPALEKHEATIEKMLQPPAKPMLATSGGKKVAKKDELDENFQDLMQRVENLETAPEFVRDKFNPNQPRNQAGAPDGGQWAAAKSARKAHVGTLTAPLTKREDLALKFYSNTAYQEWNVCLRNKSAAACKAIHKDDENEKDATSLADMFSAVRKGVLTRDAVLHRSIPTPLDHSLYIGPLKASVGRVVYFKGFTSTSRASRIAEDFGKRPDDPTVGKSIHFEIFAPKGSNAFELPDRREKEVILPHRAKFYVESVNEKPKKIIVRLHYLGVR